MSPKVVVVLGATGLQGGSVINALLAAPKGTYTIRGISRDPSSASSRALSEKGVEVVAGELSSLDSLKAAFEGAYAVFGVTMPFTPVSELVQGKNIVDACKAQGVQLLVWSSLVSASKVSNGKYTKVKHWDEKAQVDDYIKQVGQPAVVLQTGGFVENILTYHYLRPSSTPGKWVLAWPIIRPTTALHITYISLDLGPCVAKAIEVWEDKEAREKLTRAPIPVCSFEITIPQMVEIISKVTGKEVEYERIPSMPNEELTEMLLVADEGLQFPGVTFPPQIFVDLGVKFHTFEDYVRKELLPKMAANPTEAGRQ